VAGLWFFQGPPVFSTNKTDRHDITEILLKVAFNTITHNVFSTITYDLGYILGILALPFPNKRPKNIPYMQT
jgi:hypothetical protein